MNKILCNNCNIKNEEHSVFCHQCGEILNYNNTENNTDKYSNIIRLVNMWRMN
jgi:uncharacterized membrane protein YvbJ